MLYVGLDVHQKTSTFCILDGNGMKIRTRTLRGHRDRLLAELRRIDQPFAICFEASCGYGSLYDELSKIACQVLMAHPGHLRLIFRSKRKSDRVDAEKLAKLLFLGEVPAAYVPSVDVRSWRELIEYRRRVVDKETRCKSGLRALVRSHGLKAPRGLWTRRGRGWLEAVELPTPAAT